MKKSLIILILAIGCCINYGCVQAEFKTVHGKKAPYSISIPGEYSAVDSDPIDIDTSLIDLRYYDSKDGSISTAVKNIRTDDTTGYSKEFASLSFLELSRKMDPSGRSNLIIFERKVLNINGVNSYYMYYRSDDYYYQVVFQFYNNKRLHLICSYKSQEPDSLRQLFYGVVNSVVWE